MGNPTENREKLDVWPRATSLATLASAWEKVRANDGAAGADGVSIDAYGRQLTQRLMSLSRRLADGTYEPGPFRRVDIQKKKGGNRQLMIPTVEDRTVHTALALILAPILEPLFENSSFAYRPGRSVRQAVTAIERWRDAGYVHVIDADIIDYFNAVRHDVLLSALEKALEGCTGVQALLDFIAEDLKHQGAALGHDGLGLVQGSPLSPLLANLYLDVLDEKIHGHGIRLVRFADDFVILCKKKRNAENALATAQSVLASLGLRLHPGNTRIVNFDRGFQFLGYLFVRSLAMAQDSQRERESFNAHKIDDAAETGFHIAAKSGLKSSELMPASEGRYSRGARVLYVLERGRRIAMRNDSFAVLRRDGGELTAIAHNRVDRMEIGPDVSADAEVVENCLSNGTDLVFVNGNGETRGRLIPGKDKMAALQLAQAKACLDPCVSRKVARALVDARIRNQRTQLFRLNRRQMEDGVVGALVAMGRYLRKLNDNLSIAQLRGIEGAASAEYWPALGRLCKESQVPFRRTRPARDPLNATINYLTAILERDIRGALQSTGLHLGFGTLHAQGDYSEAAVYDFMEPFRAALTEGLAVFLFNANRLRLDMFDCQEDGRVRITPPARTAIVSGYEQAVAKRVTAPNAPSKLAWRRMMKRQALDYAKAVRACDSALFRPYLMEA
jgi:CRISPR-associated protein Cas1